MFGERCCEKVCSGGVSVRSACVRRGVAVRKCVRGRGCEKVCSGNGSVRKCVRGGVAMRGCVRGGVAVRGCVRGEVAMSGCVRGGVFVRKCFRGGVSVSKCVRRGVVARLSRRCPVGVPSVRCEIVNSKMKSNSDSACMLVAFIHAMSATHCAHVCSVIVFLCFICVLRSRRWCLVACRCPVGVPSVSRRCAGRL